MPIPSPFRHEVPLSSTNQPAKPVLPVQQDNIFAAESDIATDLSGVYDVYTSDYVKEATADVAIEQALAIITRSRDKAKSDKFISNLSNADIDADNAQTIISNLMSRVGTSGFGAITASMSAVLINAKSFRQNCDGIIYYPNQFQHDVAGYITTFSGPNSTSLDCEGFIGTTHLQTLSYRWGTDSAVDNFALESSNTPHFSVVRGTKYILAIRVRVPAGATVRNSSDWFLNYASATDPNTWIEISDVTDISKELPDNFRYPVDMVFFTLPYSNFVTSPGPGATVANFRDGIYAYGDSQSPSLTQENIMRESEFIICIKPSLGMAAGDYHFRVVSSRPEGDYIDSFYSRLDLPWITIT